MERHEMGTITGQLTYYASIMLDAFHVYYAQNYAGIYNRHKNNEFIYKFSLICRCISCVYTPMQSLRIGCKAMSHLGHINLRHMQQQ